MSPTVSVVLGTYERLPFLKLTIDSLRMELAEIPHEIIVVDGGSADGTIEWLAVQKDVITIVQHNRGEWDGKPLVRRSWGYFMNLGFKAAAGKYICMVSDDCLIVPDSIRNGVKLFDGQIQSGRKVGAVAFYWRNWPEATRYWVGRTLGHKIFVNHGLYHRDALESVGFAEADRYLFYHADGDMCLKLWHSGYECIDCPSSFVEHFSHANLGVRASNQSRQKEDWDMYRKTWTGIFYDPAADFSGDWIEKDFRDTTRTAEKFRGVMSLKLAAHDRLVRQGLKPYLERHGWMEFVQKMLRAIRGTPN